jgi:hypothetical protein
MADPLRQLHADGIIVGVFGNFGNVDAAASVCKPSQNIQIKEVTILGNNPNLTLNPGWTPYHWSVVRPHSCTYGHRSRG